MPNDEFIPVLGFTNGMVDCKALTASRLVCGTYFESKAIIRQPVFEYIEVDYNFYIGSNRHTILTEQPYTPSNSRRTTCSNTRICSPHLVS